MTSFLQKVAAALLKQHSDLSTVQVVMPSQRSAIFLKRALANGSDKPRWAPHITTINEWVFIWSGLQKADSLALLFWAYRCYEEVFQSQADSFDTFARWAPTMLSDFSEIDSQLVPAGDILNYLADAKRIEHWEPQAGSTESTLQQYLKMWSLMPQVYDNLQKDLTAKKRAYQGMAYRKANAALPQILSQLSKTYSKIYFCGFNVLTRAEESIFRALHKANLAGFYWDTDLWYWSQKEHEAAAGMQKINLVGELMDQQKFHYLHHSIQKHPLTLHEVSATGNHAQIMAAQKILEKIPANELHETALILADESLLLPFLENLTPHVSNLNVTMGLPLNSHPLAGFFNHLLQGYLESEKQSRMTGKEALQFHARWWEQLTSFREIQLLLGKDNIEKLGLALKNQNRTRLTWRQLQADTKVELPTIMEVIFSEKSGPVALFNKFIHLTDTLAPLAVNHLHKEALHHFFTLFQRLHELLEPQATLFNYETAHNFYRQVLQNESMDLIGEPLNGLQVMGTLESRNLDFKNVILLSFNEGIFPKGGGRDSFIPFDIKKKYGLPTFLDKDSTYAYYFYRMLHRTEQLWMVYNSEIGALQSGEASRYLLQVKKELAPDLSNVEYKSYVLQNTNMQLAEQLQERPKSKAVMERLKQKAERGFSYSALSNFLKNPLLFYYQDLLSLQEANKWEPTITPRELGTTVHHVLEDLYRPFLNQRLSAKEPFLNLSAKKIEKLLREKYCSLSGERNFAQGHDLLKMDQMIIMVQQFLRNEKLLVQEPSNELIVSSLEKEYSSELVLPQGQKVVIKGLIDRVDIFNGIPRIIDYKTGSANEQDYSLTELEQYRKPEKIKALQLIIYTYLYFRNHPEASEVIAAVISLQKNSKAFVPLAIKKEKRLKREQLAAIEEELGIILQELFDQDKPFSEQAPFLEYDEP